jgi:hypothetical protein
LVVRQHRSNKSSIYREPIGNEPTQPNGLVFIGNGTFVVGARPMLGQPIPTRP